MNLIVLVGTFALGLAVDAHDRTTDAGRLFGYHFLAGLFAAVFTLLVHSIVFTYFIGTGRWVKEIRNSYPLSKTFAARASRLKLRVLAAAMTSMLLVIATAGFGAAADPASSVDFQGWAGLSPASLHLIVAVLTVAVNLAAFVVELLAVGRNVRLIDEVMGAVRRIRSERGLEPEPAMSR